MKSKLILFLSLATFILAFTACKKNAENSTLQIHMTDAPLGIDEVNIDLREVRVKFDRDTAAWVSLQTNAGVYDLLKLQNGIDTLIAQGSFPISTVKEIRLILGPDNTVKADGQIYDLTIPSGEESGLKIKINKKLQATIETLLIDFDAALSIKKENDGYKLRPVIKLK